MTTAEMTSSRDVLDFPLYDFVQLIKSLPPDTPEFDKVSVMTAWVQYNFIDRCCHVATLLSMVNHQDIAMQELIYMQQEWPHVFCTFEGSRFMIEAYRSHCLATADADKVYEEAGQTRGAHESWTALQNKNSNLLEQHHIPTATRRGLLQACQYTNSPFTGPQDDCPSFIQGNDLDAVASGYFPQNCRVDGECIRAASPRSCRHRSRQRGQNRPGRDRRSSDRKHQQSLQESRLGSSWPVDFNSSKGKHEPVMAGWMSISGDSGEKMMTKKRRRTRASLDRHVDIDSIGGVDSHVMNIRRNDGNAVENTNFDNAELDICRCGGSEENFDEGMRNLVNDNVNYRSKCKSRYVLRYLDTHKERYYSGTDEKKYRPRVEPKSSDSDADLTHRELGTHQDRFSNGGGASESYKWVKKDRQSYSHASAVEASKTSFNTRADLNKHHARSFRCKGNSPEKRLKRKEYENSYLVCENGALSANGKYFQQ